MLRFAQTMEAKWKLKAPEAFYSDEMENARADDDETRRNEGRTKGGHRFTGMTQDRQVVYSHNANKR